MLARKTMALMEGLSAEDVKALPPAERYRFSALCRHLADAVEKPPDRRPRSGILGALNDGKGRE